MAEPKSFPALAFLLEREMALPQFDPIVARDARAELEKAGELLAKSEIALNEMCKTVAPAR